MIIAAMGKTGRGRRAFIRAVDQKLGLLKGVEFPGPRRHLNFKDDLERIAYKLGWDGEHGEKGRGLLDDLALAIRKGIGLDYLIKLWRMKVDLAFNLGYIVLVDDVRFDNEAAAVLKLPDAYLVKITSEEDYRVNPYHLSCSSDVCPTMTYMLRPGKQNALAAAEELIEHMRGEGQLGAVQRRSYG